tara:strand:- start:6504 stop:7262 length:759 start_codon:yes stop_codon:yes gene_type:complete
MDLLPDLEINAEIADLVEQDSQDLANDLTEPTINLITQDNAKAEVENVDNMFVGLDVCPEPEVEEVKEVEDILDIVPKPKTKKGRVKKPATEKQKQHLATIRAKALETRRKNSELKKAAVIETQKKIKMEKKERNRKTPAPTLDENRRIVEEVPQLNIMEKKEEIETNEFQKFMGNMTKFMQLQEKHEIDQRKVNAEQQQKKIIAQRKIQIEENRKKKEIAVKQQQQQQVRTFIPNINKIVPETDPYDDYFG